MTDVRHTLLRHGWFHTGLLLVLLVLLNHLSSVWFLRVDLTAEQRHTLSDVARDSVRGLRRPLLARVYFSEGLEPPYHDHRAALLDKLAELAVHADAGLEVTVLDPTGDPQRVAEAERFGVRPLPYAFRSWDRTEARTIWMGVSFVYGDRQVAVDALPSLDRMEAELVCAIRRVTTEPEDTRRVGWLLGHGEPDPSESPPDGPLRQLWRGLAQTGHVRTVAPRDEPIPADLHALIVVAPQRPLHPAEVLHLDQFLMRGGSILLWLSNVQPDFERNAPRTVAHGLDGWLGHHGVRVRQEVLLDRAHTEQMVVPVDVGSGPPRMIRLNYPLALTTTNLERSERAVRDLPRLLLPFASPLEIAPSTDTLSRQVWARTMDSAVAVAELQTLDPRALEELQTGEETGPFPVVAALSGTFTSWWDGRAPPARLRPGAEPFSELTLRSRPTRMVVVGSGDALANNVSFALNAVDWLVEDGALIEVRGKGQPAAALLAPPRDEALQMKILAVAGPLLLLALIGSLTYLTRIPR